MPALTRAEARDRAALVSVTRMSVDLDLTVGPDTFASTTRIEFTAAEPGSSTFVDLKARSVSSLELNGRPLDPASVEDGRLPLDDLAADNTLLVEAVMAFRRDGSGLHRFVDPADDEAYVYGHMFLDAAPSVFACFDQPDLKSPYDVRVTAADHWVVVGNAPAVRAEDGSWRLVQEHPLATYFVTICAGPYVAVSTRHGDREVAIHAKSSLREHLERQGEEMLGVHTAGLDRFEELYGIAYPWGDYNVVLVAEFNAGAMENPGCVTMRDEYLYRGAVTDDQVLQRGNTFLHEMAHMWFGDLVTLRWWDDLWLNESFAEYMAYRVLVETTRFHDAWVEFGIYRKVWGYAAERSPSTHPIAGSPAPDAPSALQNFDGISYAKGCSAIRQLIATIGDDAFVAGIRDYLATHAHGNGTLEDFLAAMGRAAGESLDAWSHAWLETAGADTIAVDVATGAVTRTPPEAFPADRPHVLDVAGFTDGAEAWRVEARLHGEETTVAGLGPAQVVLPNAGDGTWATTRLDAATLDALPDALATIPDVTARCVAWIALLDGVSAGDVDPRVVARTVENAWPREDNAALLKWVARWFAGSLAPTFLAPADRQDARAGFARAGAAVLADAEPGSGRALAGARFLAAHSADADLLLRWSMGTDLPQGLEEDTDFRWIVVRRLAELGAIDSVGVDEAYDRDRTQGGRLASLTARAALPDAESKAWAWESLTTDASLSNHELTALGVGFWSSGSPEELEPYAGRYVTDVPRLAARVGDDAMQNVSGAAFPTPLVSRSTLDALERMLADQTLTPAVRRTTVDGAARLAEGLRSRGRFGGGA